MHEHADRERFLARLPDDLAHAYSSALRAFHDAPGASYVALRGLAERLVAHLENAAKGPLYEDIERLAKRDDVPAWVPESLHTLRIEGNNAAHPAPGRQHQVALEDALQRAWKLLAWWHPRAGGLEDDVPAFRPPSKAESYSVFRDAVLGGADRDGDPEAQYFVALAMLQRDLEVLADVAASPGRRFFRRLRDQAIDLLWGCYYRVPAARSRLASAWLDRADEEKQDVLNALDLLDESIEKGDADCAFLKGAILHEGLHGQPVDHAQALALFEKAAAHEHPGALHALAAYYSSSDLGVPVDMKRARVWAQRAAELGDPLGLHRFGCMLVEGHGGPKDAQRGAALLRRALDLGVPDAAWFLSHYLRDGLVDPVGEETPDALLDLACSKHSSLALRDRLKRKLEVAQKQGPSGDLRLWARIIEDLHVLHEAVSPVELDDLKRLTADILNAIKLTARQVRDPERRVPLTTLLTHFRSDGTARSAKERDGLIVDAYEWLMGEGEYNLEAMTVHAQAFGHLEADRVRDEAMRKELARDEDDLRAQAKKAGRNALCPCGSGRKSKQCHGR